MSHSLSYSRARAFDECPAKFKVEYILRRPRGVGEPPLIVGTLIHECCDRYVRHLMATGQSSDFAKMDEIFEHVWYSSLRDGLPESLKPETYALAVKATHSLIFEDIKKVSGSELKLAVDREWRPVDYNAGNAFVRARIDRLDMDEEGNARVVDYKTGHRIVGIGDSHQVKLYCRIVVAHYPSIQTVDAELNYIRHGSTRSGRVGPEEMDSARQWIEGVGRGIEAAAESGKYPARPGQACRGCAAFRDCPARAVSVKPVPPGDEVEAVDLVRRLILVERERKEIFEAITSWVDQFGSVEVNGMALGYMKEERLEFDVAKVATILETRGLRPLKYMRVDTNEIRRLGRMDSRIADELKKSARDASQTKLKLNLASGENEQ